MYTHCMYICRLDQNYQLEEGVCLPRSTIYEHYLDFCERESIQPVNAASFGKVIITCVPPNYYIVAMCICTLR